MDEMSPGANLSHQTGEPEVAAAEKGEATATMTMRAAATMMDAATRRPAGTSRATGDQGQE